MDYYNPFQVQVKSYIYVNESVDSSKLGIQEEMILSCAFFLTNYAADTISFEWYDK